MKYYTNENISIGFTAIFAVLVLVQAHVEVYYTVLVQVGWNMEYTCTVPGTCTPSTV